MISDEDLISAYERGLIPGPNEAEFSFLKRVRRAGQLQSVIKQELFGFSIDWVPVVISNKNLLPWEGAAVWISEGEVPQIQLRKSLFGTKFLLKDRRDFLVHEAAHAARCLFEEPQFEEILAYLSSKNRFRKFWGPLFRSSKESGLFIMALIISLPCQWLLPSLLYLFPLPLLGYFIFRLVKAQRIFTQCLKKTSYPFMLCLTDKEITHFSQIPQEEIGVYLSKKEGPRDHLLRALKVTNSSSRVFSAV